MIRFGLPAQCVLFIPNQRSVTIINCEYIFLRLIDPLVKLMFDSIENYIDSLYSSLFCDLTMDAPSGSNTSRIPVTVTQPRIHDFMHSTPKPDTNQKKRRNNSSLLVESSSMTDNMIPDYQSLVVRMDNMESKLSGLITRSNEETMRKLDEVKDQQHQLQVTVKEQNKQIQELREENRMLNVHAAILEGRLTRAEKVIDDIKEEVLQSTARSMKDNLVFYRIPEKPSENVTQVLLEFMEQELKISRTDIKDIQIKKAHRLGKVGQSNRAIIAQLNSTGVSTVMSHTKNLKGRPYGVNVQMPKEQMERKKQLLPLAKEAKRANKKVTWSGDKLYIDSLEHKIRPDKVRNINQNTTERTMSLKVNRAQPKVHEGSQFQGSKVKLESDNDIIPALHAIYQDHRVARATHNIYAYRLERDGNILEHYNDDGEYGAGSHILQILQQTGKTNILICVTRWYGGRHIGPVRFNLIEEAANRAIAL